MKGGLLKKGDLFTIAFFCLSLIAFQSNRALIDRCKTGTYFLNKRDYSNALINYLYAIDLADKARNNGIGAILYIKCCNIFIKTKQPDKALVYAKISAAMIKKDNPLFIDINSNIAECLILKDKKSEALAYFRKNIMFKKGNGIKQQFDYWHIANLYLSMRKYDSANIYYIKEFIGSKMNKVDNFNLYNNCAVISHMKGELKKAEFLYYKALSYNYEFDKARTYLNLSELYNSNKDDKKALACLNLAIKLNPEPRHLGNVYLLLGFKTKAIEILKEVKEQQDETKEIERKYKLKMLFTESNTILKIQTASTLQRIEYVQVADYLQTAYIVILTMACFVLSKNYFPNRK